MFATSSDLRQTQILKAQSAETRLNKSIVQITLVIDNTNTIFDSTAFLNSIGFFTNL